MSDQHFTGDDGAPAGWVTLSRRRDTFALIRRSNAAFALLTILALRAKWRPGFNSHGLEIGEALLGDYQNCGLTRRQYRTAIDLLSRWQFATFKTTNKGTVGKLIDSRLFSISSEASGQQNGQHAASKRPLTNKGTIKQWNQKEPKKVASLPVVSEIEIPPPLNTEAFRAIWKTWVEFRLAMKSPKNPEVMFRQQPKTLSAFSVADAIAAIEKSIGSGWQGLHPEKPRSQPPSRNAGTHNEGTADAYAAADERQRQARLNSPEVLRQVQDVPEGCQ